MNPIVFEVLEAASGVLAVLGSLFVATSAVAMLRQRDAFARINVLSPATGMGMPLIVVAAFVHRVAIGTATASDLVKTLVTIGALLIVSSVASNILARAAYLSGAPVFPGTDPQDLANEPDAPAD